MQASGRHTRTDRTPYQVEVLRAGSVVHQETVEVRDETSLAVDL